MNRRRLFIDLSDLVTNTIWHRATTGIQRVQIALADELVRADGAIAFSLFNADWRDLTADVIASKGDPDEFTRRLGQGHKATLWLRETTRQGGLLDVGYRAWRRGARALTMGRLRHLARSYIQPSDTLIAVGAFWQMPPLIDVYEDAVRRGVSMVGLCHDLLPILDVPTWNNHSYQLARFLDLPAAMLTVSQFSKAEMARAAALGLIAPRSAPTVVPLAQEFSGAERNAVVASASERVRAIANGPYVLMVGSYEPRKNHRAAIAAWRTLQSSRGRSLPRLVLAGKSNSAALAEIAGMEQVITWIDRPTEDELASLYSNCEFTIFPSLAEGWGLPVGESLWFGKACASSNAASLPEVGGDLCCYFDPGDDRSFVAAVERLLDPSFRAASEDAIKASTLRTWRDVFSELRDAVRQVARAPHSGH